MLFLGPNCAPHSSGLGVKIAPSMQLWCSKYLEVIPSVMAAVLPRSFRLLEELEKGEKGGPSILAHTNRMLGLGDGSCSYGLADGDDITMTNWNGTILGPPHVSSCIILGVAHISYTECPRKPNLQLKNHLWESVSRCAASSLFYLQNQPPMC